MQTKDETIAMYDNGSDAAKGLDGAELLYSVYNSGCYEGDWLVVWVDSAGALMYDSGWHCSCYGPEFAASPTTVAHLLETFKDEPDLVKVLNDRFPKRELFGEDLLD